MKRAGAAASALLGRAPSVLGGTQVERHALRVLNALDVRVDSDIDRLSVPGGPGAPGTLIVANHISWLDIVALLAIEPLSFVAKREVRDWPVIGSLAARLGTCFVDRHALRELPASVAELAETLCSGRSVMVFPEGTTWCSLPGGDFRRAPFQAALDAGAPVRPLTIEYFQGGRPSTVSAFVGDDTLAASLGRVLTASGLTLRLRAHEVLAAEGDRRTLAATAQRRIRAAGAAELACSHLGGPVHA